MAVTWDQKQGIPADHTQLPLHICNVKIFFELSAFCINEQGESTLMRVGGYR